MTKEAMKLALEALMRSRKAVSGDLDLAGCAYGKNDPDGHRYADAKKALVTLDKAVIALREALAEQPAQQEPIATLWQHSETGRTRITMPGDITDCDARWFKATALYAAPPPQRIWVGLTDEERDAIFELHNTRLGGWDYSGDKVMYYGHFEDAVAAIEAKLKEKNT